MRIACLSDVHGNLPAWESVLAAVENEGVDHILIMGDHAAWGPHPKETVEAIRRLDENGRATIIRGNTDEYITGDRSFPEMPSEQRPIFTHMVEWARDQLNEDDHRYLRHLPLETTVSAGKTALRVCHASPEDTETVILPSASSDELEVFFDDSPAQIAGYGHIHRPYVRWISEGRCVFNAGTVGSPMSGGPKGSWALIHIREQENNAGDSVTIYHTAYDPGPLIEDARRRDYPHIEQRLRFWQGRPTP